MTNVKIKKIGNTYTVNTQYGEKTKIDYLVETNTGSVIQASRFVRSSDPDVRVGDEVLMEIKQSGKFYNITKMEPLLDEIEPEARNVLSGTDFTGNVAPRASEGPKTAIPEALLNNKPDWDAKDRRMVRMNSWAHAVEIVKVSLKEPLSEGDICNLCEMIAHRIEDDIYRKA